jgi:hypothetical protein
MARCAVRKGLASFVLVAASLAGARADAAELLRLSWDAPSECPSAESVRSAAVRNAPAAAIPLEADAVVSHRDRWTVTLKTRRPEASGERVLEAASCTALADATALILALALVPPGEEELRAPAGKPEPQTPTTSAPPVTEDRPPPSPASPSSSNAKPGPPALAIGGFAATDATTLPGVGLGGGGLVAWTPGALRIEALVSTFAGQSQTVDQSTAGARFSMTSLAAGACYTVLKSVIELAPCGGGSMHWVTAEGFGATANYDASARWAAIDAGLLARAPLTSWLALRARADGLVPLGRPSFEVENEGVVHKPPPFGIRAALGVELNFL